jgi:hypothetical protein
MTDPAPAPAPTEPVAPAPTADPAPDPAPTPTPDPAPDPPKPPWGSDEDFNPEKAWNLITNLRGDIEKLKPQAAKAKELEDAQLTEQQRLEKERDEARESAATTGREAALYKAAIDHGLGAEDLELLEGVPADQIDTRAKRLSERLAESTAPRNPRPDPTQGPRGGGVDLDAQIAEAQKAGDYKKVISLQNQKLTKQATK